MTKSLVGFWRCECTGVRAGPLRPPSRRRDVGPDPSTSEVPPGPPSSASLPVHPTRRRTSYDPPSFLRRSPVGPEGDLGVPGGTDACRQERRNGSRGRGEDPRTTSGRTRVFRTGEQWGGWGQGSGFGGVFTVGLRCCDPKQFHVPCYPRKCPCPFPESFWDPSPRTSPPHLSSLPSISPLLFAPCLSTPSLGPLCPSLLCYNPYSPSLTLSRAVSSILLFPPVPRVLSALYYVFVWFSRPSVSVSPLAPGVSGSSGRSWVSSRFGGLWGTEVGTRAGTPRRRVFRRSSGERFRVGSVR